MIRIIYINTGIRLVDEMLNKRTIKKAERFFRSPYTKRDVDWAPRTEEEYQWFYAVMQLYGWYTGSLKGFWEVIYGDSRPNEKVRRELREILNRIEKEICK